jgi:transposase
MTRLADTVEGVVGVDTHRDTLAAAATDRVGGSLAELTAAADLAGYQRLLAFGQAQVPGRRCWAVEGAGSYGAGLTGVLQAHGELVVEIGRPKRPARRTGAKSDALDALRAAREALACDHLVMPRRRGDREALRVLLATRRSACAAKVAAINQLKAHHRAGSAPRRPQQPRLRRSAKVAGQEHQGYSPVLEASRRPPALQAA